MTSRAEGARPRASQSRLSQERDISTIGASQGSRTQRENMRSKISIPTHKFEITGEVGTWNMEWTTS